MTKNRRIATDIFNGLYGIEAIDKFIAIEFALPESLDEKENEIWLHLLVALSYMQRNGHSCLPLNVLAGCTWFSDPGLSDVVEDTDTKTVDEVKVGYRFCALTPLIGVVKKALLAPNISSLFVYSQGVFYSRRYFEFEQEVAGQLANRTRFVNLEEQALSQVKALWPAMFPTSMQAHQDWQQIAVAKSLVQHFSVINGGPGTGKTYTVLRLILALQAMDAGLNIVLAAPTGKAQQRMTESILSNIAGLRGKVDDTYLNRVPTTATTLHRLLGIREYTVATKYDQYNPLNLDVLIVDEASMVDLALMTRIMRALPDHARLYFIGDADQLPAVELGNVLEQLVGHSAHDAPHANLDEAKLGAVPTPLRQHIASLCPHLPLLPVDEDAKTWVHTLQAPQRFKGQIAKVATAIQKGEADAALASITPGVDELADSTSYVSVLQSGVTMRSEQDISKVQLQRMAKESYATVFAATTVDDALKRLNKVRWLTPIRNGSMGVEGLNTLIYDAIKHNIVRREGSFYQGQPIMITKNNHPQRLSNGEVGIIWPDSSGKLYAWFETQEGDLRHIALSRVPQYETVYAMTIHKSQGSEFDNVVLLLPKPESAKSASLFHRGLVYTGLTRAKKGCLIIADSPTFKDMVINLDTRYSGLANAISEKAMGLSEASQ